MLRVGGKRISKSGFQSNVANEVNSGPAISKDRDEHPGPGELEPGVRGYNNNNNNNNTVLYTGLPIQQQKCCYQ